MSQGVLVESGGPDSNDHIFMLVESISDANKSSGNGGSCEELLVCDEERESTVASVEDQLLKEMTVYEVC